MQMTHLKKRGKREEEIMSNLLSTDFVATEENKEGL